MNAKIKMQCSPPLPYFARRSGVATPTASQARQRSTMIRPFAVSRFRLTQPAIKLSFRAQENHPDNYPGVAAG